MSVANLKPRKTGRQVRAQETVKALVEATARVLAREGFHQASTNRIALEAGVSIGSLYQYFPSKEALVLAVVERHKSEMMDLLRSTIAEAEALPLDEAIRALVRMMIEAHRIDPQLHRVLVEEVPRSGRLGAVETFEHEAYPVIRAFLESRQQDIRPPDLDLAAYVCVRSIEALVHGAVLHRPALLAGADTFEDEITRLITFYLRQGT